MFHVRDNNGGVIRSAHETQREAKAAINRSIAADELEKATTEKKA
jgi:hypothetical protein